MMQMPVFLKLKCLSFVLNTQILWIPLSHIPVADQYFILKFTAQSTNADAVEPLTMAEPA
jgi:hypothetical protein